MAPRQCSNLRSRFSDAFRFPGGSESILEECVLENLKAFFLTEEIGLTNSEMACQNLNLVLCQRGRHKPLHARFYILKIKLSGGIANPPFEVTPALSRKVQSHLSSDEFAEMGKRSV